MASEPVGTEDWLPTRIHTVTGKRYYEFQDRHTPARIQARNAWRLLKIVGARG